MSSDPALPRRRKRQYVILPARKRRAAPDAGTRRAWIAEAAYQRAVKRNFENGNPTEDWLAAESEIDARLRH